MMRIQTRSEVKKRRMRYQVFTGFFDFLGILAGVIVIIACAFLIKSLVDYVMAEGQSMFKVFWQIFTDALIIPE